MAITLSITYPPQTVFCLYTQNVMLWYSKHFIFSAGKTVSESATVSHIADGCTLPLSSNKISKSTYRLRFGQAHVRSHCKNLKLVVLPQFHGFRRHPLFQPSSNLQGWVTRVGDDSHEGQLSKSRTCIEARTCNL